MTAAGFRKIALSFTDAVESEHMGHPDFRVGGRIFATLGPSQEKSEWGMVKLTPAQRRDLMKQRPGALESFPGAWGRSGCTRVLLDQIDARTLRRALSAAWSNTAPKKLVEEFGPRERK